MNIMRRFTLRSLHQNRKRTIVTIIGVILSVSMITAVSSLAASFVGLLQRDNIATYGNWHVKISGARAEDIPAIEKDGGIDQCIWGREIGYTPLKDTNERFLFLMQYTKEGFSQMSIRPVSGRLPENSREVAISQRALSAGLEIRIGDTLTLQSGQRLDTAGDVLTGNPAADINIYEDGVRRLYETFQPGPEAEYTVVGIIEQPEFDKSWSAGYGVLGFLDIPALSPLDTVDAYYTAKTVSRGLIDHGRALAAKANIPEGNVAFNTSLLRYYGVMGSDRQSLFFYQMMLVMIAVIAAASVCLIYNAFAISVAERARQLGLLSSVGATLNQKRSAIYFEGFVIAVIGIPLGISAGVLGIFVTLQFLRPLLNAVLYTSDHVELVLQVPLWSIAVTVFFSLVTIFLSVLLPARHASRITPMEAIRLTREVKLTRRAVKTSRLTTRLFGFEAALALKNIKRNRKKGRATIVSLAISLVLFLTVSQYVSLMSATAGAMSEGFNYDITMSYGSAPEAVRLAADSEIAGLKEAREILFADNLLCTVPLQASQMAEQTRSLLGASETEPYRYHLNLVGLRQADFEAYAVKLKQDPALYMDAGHPMGILINYGQETIIQEDGSTKKMIGAILNLRPGDMLSISDGNIEAPQALQVAIGALTDERPMGTAISSYFRTTMVVSQPVFDAIAAAMAGGKLPESVYHSVHLIAAGDDQVLEKQLTDLLARHAILNYGMFNVHSAARAEHNRNLFLGILIYGFITLITLICIANILNTVSTSIALRRKEFAMLRSVGMTPGSFHRMIRYESVFYGLKGLLYGLPLSLLTSFLLFRINSLVLDFVFRLPWKSYLFAVLLILAIVLATMLYATAKIRKENIVDALKEENI